MNAVERDEYLTEVARALADLPEDVREELLEDLPAHLAELRAEGIDLQERLGTPAAYADELRAAAGLDRRRRPAGPLFDLTEARRLARVTDRRVGTLLGYGQATEFLRLLRPAWWIVRGYAVGMLFLGVVAGNPGPLPDARGNEVTGWLIVLPFVVLSVRYGPLVLRLPERFRPLVYIVTGSLALLILAGVASWDNRYHWWDQRETGDPYADITDVYPYGSDGRPLDGVRLFDQRGNPIILGQPWSCPEPTPDPTNTGQAGTAQPDTGPTYAYPLCRPAATAPPTTPTPTPAPTPTPSANPSPSAKPTPSANPTPTTAPGGTTPGPTSSGTR